MPSPPCYKIPLCTNICLNGPLYVWHNSYKVFHILLQCMRIKDMEQI